MLQGQNAPLVKLKQGSLSRATKNDHNAALLVWFSECIMSLISSLAIVLSLLIPLSCPQACQLLYACPIHH